MATYPREERGTGRGDFQSSLSRAASTPRWACHLSVERNRSAHASLMRDAVACSAGIARCAQAFLARTSLVPDTSKELSPKCFGCRRRTPLAHAQLAGILDQRVVLAGQFFISDIWRSWYHGYHLRPVAAASPFGNREDRRSHLGRLPRTNRIYEKASRSELKSVARLSSLARPPLPLVAERAQVWGFCF